MQEELKRKLDELGLRSYIESHLLPHPVAVWVMSDAEIDDEAVREVSRHFDADDTFDGG